MKKYRNIQNQLFIITILFFFIGMINITFSLFALTCFILPFYFYYRYSRKIWCQSFCPRAGMFNVVLSKISLKKKPPKFLTGKFIREFFVNYFFVSLTVVIFSTAMVAIGRINPLTDVRFFLLFVLPFNLPQLITIGVSPALIHLGYRIYSMFFTTVTVGVILGVIYQPRTWCAICPINSLTTKKIKLDPSLKIKKNP